MKLFFPLGPVENSYFFLSPDVSYWDGASSESKAKKTKGKKKSHLTV